MMTPAAYYDLADARRRAREAARMMRSDSWTIGDPLAAWTIAVRDIARARRTLRRAHVPIPPSRPVRLRVTCCPLDTAPVLMEHSGTRPSGRRVTIWTAADCPQHREAAR